MTILEFTVVCIRLFAVGLIVLAISLLPDSIMMAGMEDPYEGVSTLIYLFPPLFYMLVAVLLWGFSRVVARFVVPDSSLSATLPDPNVEVLERLGLSLLGFYTISWSIPDLVRIGLVRYANAEDFIFNVSHIDPFEEVATLVSLTIGVGLIFGARGIQDLLKKLRHYGA